MTADVCSTAQRSCFPRNGSPNGEICGLEILKEVINLARNNPLDYQVRRGHLISLDAIFLLLPKQ
jgi:hypothetical protein